MAAQKFVLFFLPTFHSFFSLLGVFSLNFGINATNTKIPREDSQKGENRKEFWA